MNKSEIIYGLRSMSNDSEIDKNFKNKLINRLVNDRMENNKYFLFRILNLNLIFFLTVTSIFLIIPFILSRSNPDIDLLDKVKAENQEMLVMTASKTSFESVVSEGEAFVVDLQTYPSIKDCETFIGWGNLPGKRVWYTDNNSSIYQHTLGDELVEFSSQDQGVEIYYLGGDYAIKRKNFVLNDIGQDTPLSVYQTDSKMGSTIWNGEEYYTFISDEYDYDCNGTAYDGYVDYISSSTSNLDYDEKLVEKILVDKNTYDIVRKEVYLGEVQEEKIIASFDYENVPLSEISKVRLDFPVIETETVAEAQPVFSLSNNEGFLELAREKDIQIIKTNGAKIKFAQGGYFESKFDGVEDRSFYSNTEMGELVYSMYYKAQKDLWDKTNIETGEYGLGYEIEGLGSRLVVYPGRLDYEKDLFNIGTADPSNHYIHEREDEFINIDGNRVEAKFYGVTWNQGDDVPVRYYADIVFYIGDHTYVFENGNMELIRSLNFVTIDPDLIGEDDFVSI